MKISETNFSRSKQIHPTNPRADNTSISYTVTRERLPLRITVPLQKRKLIKSSIKGVGCLLLVLCIALGALYISQLVKGSSVSTFTICIGAAIFLCAFTWEFAYPLFYFLTYYYDIDANNVVIRKGVLARREITLPYARITDVYLEQDMLDVLLGLYNVYISSPTVESGKFAHIGGLNKEGARIIRERILSGINAIQYYRE